MNKHHYVAIMAGGIGSRFWPMSRTNYPKQFLDILNTGKTLIQQTFDRYAKFIPVKNIYVITSQEYSSIVKKQLPDLPEENILGEPSRKNTAPCIASQGPADRCSFGPSYPGRGQVQGNLR
jgi:mannose-1-phosphate guanylyltransferase